MPDEFTYMWNLQDQINAHAEEKQTHGLIERFEGFHGERQESQNSRGEVGRSTGWGGGSEKL